MDRCKQYVCTQKKAILAVAIMMLFIIVVALLASLARPFGAPSFCPGENKNKTTSTKIKVQNYISKDGRQFPWQDIRLPTSVIPLSYELTMHPNLTTFQFQGTVTIMLEAKKSVDYIVIHSKKPIKIQNYRLFADLSDKSIEISDFYEYEGNEQVYLKLANTLVATRQYKLTLEFSGELLHALAGFYRSSYKTKEGKEVWLATTHFEATDARAAFPCFDEPEFKAVFSMKMIRDPRYTSLFNTALERTVQRPDGLVEDHFGKSVKMSTYLVAFVVCDYLNISATTKTNVKVSVFTPPELINEGSYALDVAVKILEYYEKFFGVPYPMPKQDLIAIPDFAAGAMENWGLITYRMTALLYNSDQSSTSNKQWVAVVVAHELAHQWFGNLVTMKWWNDLWLNEGFASFTEYIGTDFVAPEFKMLDQFITETLTGALHSDCLSSSHPISVKVDDPSEIAEIFDHISYGKGSSIIRMLESFISREVLENGLQKYLDDHQFENAETADLWKSMSYAAKKKDIDVDVKKIMDTWTLQMGYPLIRIKRKGEDIYATQERFLLNPHGHLSTEFTSPFGYRWQVPLTYITDKNNYDTKLQIPEDYTFWMENGPLNFSVPGGYKWIKFNAGFKGFYRVLYEQNDLQSLMNQLSEDRTVFSVADRANLVDDTFSLARAGLFDVENALELSKYLINEDSYVVWSVALENLEYIGLMLEEKPTYKYYSAFISHLAKNLLNKFGWEDVQDQLDKYLQSLVLLLGVQHNDKDTVMKAKQLYKEWMTDGKNLPVDTKNVIYRAGIQYGGEEEWLYMWHQFQKTTSASEKRKFLYALSTTTDAIRLNRYLHMALDKDKIRSGDTISVVTHIANNPAGRVLAWRFVKQNWAEFEARYADGSFDMSNLILRTTNRFSTDYDYNEIKDFYEHHNTGSGARAVTQMLESVEMNIEWMKKNEQNCVKWLEKETRSYT